MRDCFFPCRKDRQKFWFFLNSLLLALLAAACAAGTPPGENTSTAPLVVETDVPLIPQISSVVGPDLTETVPPSRPAATETSALTAEQALASAPPLPTIGIPLLPSRVPTELPLQTPAGPGTPSGAGLYYPPTPACGSLALTPADMEGPYFLDNTPERSSFIEPGMTGTRLIITGYVLTADCRPVPDAQIEFWQAGPDGDYDLQGYRFRGHLFTDANGFYRLETLLPAVYGGRPRHVHVKVRPQNAAELTTQLYFSGDSPSPALTVAYDETAGEALAVFTFVIQASNP